MLTKTLTAVALATALTATAALPSFAADEMNLAPGLSAAGAPVALHGADPVALLDQRDDVPGSAKYTSVHDGAAYYFASAENQSAFDANPDRYVVQNGGFCTFGVSVGKKFDGDPRFHSVVDDKVYVFLNKDIYDLYLQDRAGTIAKADQQWAVIEHTAAGDL